MDLGERKKQILQAIIDDYINTAEPIGSRSIVKRHDLGLSPATIRNEMADLEDMGFLDKPHTSAGRVPSHLGYRFYVDQLMREYKLSLSEVNRLKEEMELKIKELDRLISESTAAISRLTNYTSLISAPKPLDNRLKSIRLYLVETDSVLVILCIDDGIIKDGVLRGISIPAERLEFLCRVLGEKLQNAAFKDINADLAAQIHTIAPDCRQLTDRVFGFINDAMKSDGNKVYMAGAANMFRYPEYNNIDKARKFLDFLENPEHMVDMVDSNGRGVRIAIGKELQFEELHDCSVVISTYDIGGKLSGNIALIGPTRMDYSRTVSLIKMIAQRLQDIMYDLYFE